MVEHRAFAFLHARQFLREIRKALHVIALDHRQSSDAFAIVRVMAHWMESIRHANMGVGAICGLSGHYERDDARQIRLVGEGDQIEQQSHLLIEVLDDANRRVRNVGASQLARVSHSNPAFDLAHAVQVI